MSVAAKARKMLNKRHRLPIKAKSLLRNVDRASTHFTKGVDHYITEKPYKAMGIMMIAGVCIGFLMHRH